MLDTEYKLVESGLHRTELQVGPSTPGGTRPKAGEDQSPPEREERCTTQSLSYPIYKVGITPIHLLGLL